MSTTITKAGKDKLEKKLNALYIILHQRGFYGRVVMCFNKGTQVGGIQLKYNCDSSLQFISDLRICKGSKYQIVMENGDIITLNYNITLQ